MKQKIYLWSIALVFLCACSKNEPEIQLNETESKVMNMQVPEECRIDEETAMENAIRHLQLTDNESKIERKVKSARRVSCISNQNGKSDNDSYYYLFNFENNEGFAIASADTRDSVDIFIASPEGNLPPQEWSDTGQYSYLKELVDNYHAMKVAEADTSSHTTTNKVKRKDPYSRWENVKSTEILLNVGPLLNTRWTQLSPFNYGKQAGTLMGCGPVAMGQIMAFHHHPYFVRVPEGSYTFDWDIINLINTAEDAQQIDDGKEQVAHLLSAIGNRANVAYHTIFDYDLDGTLTGTQIKRDSIRGTFAHFGYNCNMMNAGTLSSYSLSVIENQLLLGYPVMMRGQNTNARYGHVWVIDGILKTLYTEGYVDPDTHEPVENTILEEYYYEDTRTYLWLNMGDGYIYNRIASEKHDSYLYNRPLRIYANVFMYDNQTQNNDICIWYNIYPNS